LKASILYVAIVTAGIGLLLWIVSLGAGLVAPPPTAAAFNQGRDLVEASTLLHVLLALVVIIAAARGLGAVFRYWKQPAVVGEMIAGIMLGPSLLGHFAPDVYAYVLPASAAGSLGMLAQIGVILFMFLVGLHLDTSVLRERTQSTVAVSHTSIVLPFVLGAATSLWLYPRLSTADVPFPLFALFMGIAMSITAFPVLAAILMDQRLNRTPLGVIAISCAAIDDVSAWCLLAGIVGLAKSELHESLVTLGLTVGYVVVMLVAVRPLVLRLVKQHALSGSLGHVSSTLVFGGLLASALATEFIGIHALFGAFMFGAIIPHGSELAKDIARRLQDVVTILLLPVFFAFTGMRTSIALLDDPMHWIACGLVIAVACAGKFGGGTIAARLSGLGWRDAASLGVLMNTRGLMQLIVLNIGLDLRVLSQSLFAILVIMALVTTFATTPLLNLLRRGAAAGDSLWHPRSDVST
jgi:Kef-type K+ transport system membrane component KefB